VARRPVFDVQHEIKRVIINANLAAGDALPTEAELMARLGVSRGSLREALKSLQARGIVEVVHGRGMYVGRLSMDALVDGLTFHAQLDSAADSRRLASELVDVRDLLESTLIQRVASSAEPGTLAALERIVERMEDAGEQAAPFQDLDRDFHTVLYSSIDNQVVIKLIRAFWDVLDAARPALPESQDDRVANAGHHRAILEAVRSGDIAAAREAMTAHFDGTHRWIQHTADADIRTVT
jgi:DNA-binding FadR family transcriptional regulator